jgi:hypothetical protein
MTTYSGTNAVAIGANAGLSVPSPTPSPQPHHVPYGGMPGFDVNYIIQMQFAGIMMKLIESMNDKSTGLFSYDKIITFIMLILVTDIKKWILDFVGFAKTFVATQIPTLWEYVYKNAHKIRDYIHLQWHLFCYPQAAIPLPPPENDIQETDFTPYVPPTIIEFEMNPYNMDALYQYINMTGEERIKLGSSYSHDVKVTTSDVYSTTITSKDTISSNIVYKTVDITLTDDLHMQMRNVGFNVNNITNSLCRMNQVNTSDDPMEQTFGPLEDVQMYKWIPDDNTLSKNMKTVIKSYYDRARQSKTTMSEIFDYIKISDGRFDNALYNLLHTKDTEINTNILGTVHSLYIFIIEYLKYTGDYDKLKRGQSINYISVYENIYVAMLIATFATKNAWIIYYRIIDFTNKYVILCDSNSSGIGLDVLATDVPFTLTNIHMPQGKVTPYSSHTKNGIGHNYLGANNNICYYLCSRPSRETAPVPDKIKTTAIKLYSSAALSSAVQYAKFMEFYQNVILKAPESIKALTFIKKRSITVYAISYKIIDEIKTVENPEYAEWNDMIQFISNSTSGTESPAVPASADSATATATATANATAPPLKKQPTAPLTTELLQARIEAYKMKPTKTIEKHISSKELVCEKVNVVYKHIDSLYLREADKRKITSIVDKFKNRREFYEQLGIPYKLGIMLYGHPGTGKTSTIKAVASYLEKDIYFVNLKNVRTNAELKGIFDHINEKCNGGVVVFEDMDASCDIIKRRVAVDAMVPMADTQASPIGDMVEDSTAESQKANDQLTLSYLLNLFDGTICRDGTIFAITTNHLENIDPALYRPGRVDIKIEFRKCDHYQIQQIFQHIIGRPLSANVLEKIPEYKYAPAEIIFEIMHYGLDDTITDELIMAPFMS